MSARGKGAARAVADVMEGTIIASVEIAASPQRVYDALSRSDEIPGWWGSPETCRTTEFSADLRVGGKWRASGRDAEGRPFSMEGEFLEIEPPRRLVETWKPDWDGGHVTTLTYRLEQIAGGTRLTLRHEGFDGRAESCEDHANGWLRVLRWLERHVVSATPPAHFLYKLIPPRATFAQDMTEPEAKVMQEHVRYWTRCAERGLAIAFGPVLGPKESYGIGIVEVTDEVSMRALAEEDPAIRSGLGFRFEIHVMPALVLRETI